MPTLADRLGRFEELLDGHLNEWAHLWERLSIEFETSRMNCGSCDCICCICCRRFRRTAPTSTRGCRLAVCTVRHIAATSSGTNCSSFPVLNLRLPMITRSLLGYRYRRLPEARHAASGGGLLRCDVPVADPAAMDARKANALHLNPRSGRWKPDASARAHHIGIAVAYSAWKFYQVTGDLAYLIDYGAEMLAEIARFWVSSGHLRPGARSLRASAASSGPTSSTRGYPDRPYEGVNNNAYTNVMAVWVILRAMDALTLMPLPKSAGPAREARPYSTQSCRNGITSADACSFHSTTV